jgi:hypothetical protein
MNGFNRIIFRVHLSLSSEIMVPRLVTFVTRRGYGRIGHKGYTLRELATWTKIGFLWRRFFLAIKALARHHVQALTFPRGLRRSIAFKIQKLVTHNHRRVMNTQADDPPFLQSKLAEIPKIFMASFFSIPRFFTR